MPVSVMSFDSIKPIGRVMSVDTMRVFIHVDDHEMLKEVMVGNLIAVQGATPLQLLISIVERITRLPVDSVGPSEEPDDDSAPQPENLQDTIRAVLVGTYRTKDGDSGPSFKRGADSCPQIDQPCFLIQSANLTAFKLRWQSRTVTGFSSATRRYWEAQAAERAGPWRHSLRERTHSNIRIFFFLTCTESMPRWQRVKLTASLNISRLLAQEILRSTMGIFSFCLIGF
jgi:hypothetical protein